MWRDWTMKAIYKIKKEFFNVGDYQQTIHILDGKVYDATCTCKWGTIYPDNWKKGEKICWHLNSAVIIFTRKINKIKNK